MGGLNFDIQAILYSLPAILIALTFHEVAHGWVAKLLGDNTAYAQGRLSLNPLKHLDPMGTIMLIFAGFGWAKPVPINPMNFKGNRKLGLVLTAAAGPLANLLLAIITALLMRLMIVDHIIPQNDIFLTFFFYLFQINVVLACFNIIPIPPLDGSKILFGFLPDRFMNAMYKLEQYGSIILIILLVTGVIGKVLFFLIRPVMNGIGIITGIGPLI